MEGDAEKASRSPSRSSVVSDPGPPLAQFAGYLQEYAIQAEYKLLAENNVQGVYVRPRVTDMFVWDGAIFLQQGKYAQGVFKFEIQLPKDFPSDDVPRVVFHSDLYHPMIDPDTCELDLQSKYPVWRPRQDRLHRLVAYVRRVFYKIDPTSTANAEAAEAWSNDAERLEMKVRESMRSADTQLYNDSGDSCINFSHMNQEEASKATHQLKEFKPGDTGVPGLSAGIASAGNAQTCGLSWMKNDRAFARSRDARHDR